MSEFMSESWKKFKSDWKEGGWGRTMTLVIPLYWGFLVIVIAGSFSKSGVVQQLDFKLHVIELLVQAGLGFAVLAIYSFVERKTLLGGASMFSMFTLLGLMAYKYSML